MWVASFFYHIRLLSFEYYKDKNTIIAGYHPQQYIGPNDRKQQQTNSWVKKYIAKFMFVKENSLTKIYSELGKMVSACSWSGVGIALSWAGKFCSRRRLLTWKGKFCSLWKWQFISYCRCLRWWLAGTGGSAGVAAGGAWSCW